MKRFHKWAVAGALVAVASTAMASSGSLTQFFPKSMAVLVHVDSHGRVIRVSPSVELSPTFSRLLTRNLDAWFTKPAIINGRPVDAEMIVNVSLQTLPRADGNYDASFVYLSSLPSPFSSSHWATKDGTELALIDNTGSYRQDSDYHQSPTLSYDHTGYQRSSNSTGSNISGNAAQNNSQASSASNITRSK